MGGFYTYEELLVKSRTTFHLNYINYRITLLLINSYRYVIRL